MDDIETTNFLRKSINRSVKAIAGQDLVPGLMFVFVKKKREDVPEVHLVLSSHVDSLGLRTTTTLTSDSGKTWTWQTIGSGSLHDVEEII
jgi:hypothetical protein